MWLTQQQRRRRKDGGSQVGTVTLGGDPAGVCLDGERRDLPVFAPGGYVWRPARGDQVLVLKTGADGEAPCVAGVRCAEEYGVAEGEVLLYSGGTSIRLGMDGTVSVTGKLLVNGKEVMTRE